MNTEKGWIKFYREWLDNPIITKDSEHLAVWTYLFVKAIHTEKDSIFRGKQITLKAGQLLALQKDICLCGTGLPRLVNRQGPGQAKTNNHSGLKNLTHQNSFFL